jgi:dolichol kinase
MKKDISYKEEVLRKSIHMCSLSIPIAYAFISKETALTVLTIISVMFIGTDILSKFSKTVNGLVMKFFGSILRPHEIEKKYVLNGASWVFISALMCIILFPKIIVISAFSILIISDILAALIGRKFGKHRLFTKSWEGTSAFIISAFIVISIVGSVFQAPWTFYLFGFISAIIGGIIEAASEVIKFDDNLSIPLSVGLSLWAFEYLSVSIFHLSFINLVR